VVNDLKDATGPAIGTWLFALAAALLWAAGVLVSIAATLGLVAVTRRHEKAWSRDQRSVASHARARKERDLDGRDRRNRANGRCLMHTR
jgi:UPF0716 family protein affecting phage T7 exclusion